MFETPFVVQWFVQQGIEVWSTREGQQRFDTHVDKLLNYIRFWQASGESEKTSIRVRTKHLQMIEDGQYRAATCLTGTSWFTWAAPIRKISRFETWS